MLANQTLAVLKDIKVTKKGVVISFEDVRLKGEELTELAEHIGGFVLLDISPRQIGIFEDSDVNEEDSDEQETEQSEPTELFNQGETEEADYAEEFNPNEATEQEAYNEETQAVLAELEAVQAEAVEAPVEFVPTPLAPTDEEVAKELDLN